ncbi:MAG: glutamine--tRNA ligase/YqeY domain fusion protein [Byssovorax sp.]
MSTSSELGPSEKNPKEGGAASNFIREIIEADNQSGKYGGRVVTRFPPEPNGYLHIGHAKSICLNFGLAIEFGGACHLRFDDTNPTTEDIEYVESIQRDVKWLGFDWKDKLFFASDYYERLYQFAEQLIKSGKAYVCSLSEEEVRAYRGSAFEPGKDSPYRGRSVDENLDLFRRMRAGEFPDGAHVLRAKIDMSHANMKMRDPPIYRIRHAHHYRTGDAWCIYPLYDFTHCLSDWIEGITHSICTLEFENNRELYDWFLAAVEVPNRPEQTEFARLNLTYTLMSKRKLLDLVERKFVSGWDDPRMPTIAGLRRRGYTAEALRELCDRIGVAKNNSIVDVALLEHVLREDLNQRAPRVLCVLRPLEVVIDNYPEGEVEELDAPYFPPDVPKEGSRKLPFSKTIYIERDDFLEDPPKDFYRLSPGKEVRLRYAYVIRCTSVEKDPQTGEIVRLHCSYDPATRGDTGKDARKIKGTIHWVSAAHALDAEVRLYDRLFLTEAPGSSGDDIAAELNPASLVTIKAAKIEPSLASAKALDRFQFERQGFFCVDSVDAKEGALVFNRTVPLKDTWAKISKAAAAPVSAPEKPRAKADAPKAEAPKAEKAVELSAEAIALRDAHGLSADDARILAGEPLLLACFTAAIAAHPSPKTVAKWVVNEVRRVSKSGAKDLPFTGAALGELVALVDAGTLSATLAKDVFEELSTKGGSPKAIVERRGLSQIADDGALGAAVEAVLAENADAVGRYKAGNPNLLGAFVGMVMKKTGGKANPKRVQELLKQKLG